MYLIFFRHEICCPNLREIEMGRGERERDDDDDNDALIPA